MYSFLNRLKKLIPPKLRSYLWRGYQWLKRPSIMPIIFRFYPYYSRWQESLQEGRSPLTDQIPWLIYPAIEFLDEIITPTFTIFEYGSGGSTIFFAKRAKEIISVESDSDWYPKVKQAIEKLELLNCNLIFMPSQISEKPIDLSDPNHHGSFVPEYVDRDFSDYVHVIENYPDASFDLIIIDGYARTACLRHALSKVKSQGYLLFDNVNLQKYTEALKMLETPDWHLRHSSYSFTPYVNTRHRTSIWQKR